MTESNNTQTKRGWAYPIDIPRNKNASFAANDAFGQVIVGTNIAMLEYVPPAPQPTNAPTKEPAQPTEHVPTISTTPQPHASLASTPSVTLWFVVAYVVHILTT